MPWRLRFTVLAIAGSLALAAPAALRAQEFVSTESYAARLETLEAELAALRSSVANAGETGDGSCCPDIESTRIYSPGRCAGLIGGLEVYAARPHSSMGIRGATGADLHFDYEATPRIWIGWQGEGGLGLRARYWEFDQIEFGSAANGGTDSIAYDTYVLDLEAIDTMQLNADWIVTLAAGFRYVDFTEVRQAVDAAGAPIAGQSFDGDSFGATIGAEVRRPLWNCLMGYASARGSVLFGDQSEFTGPTGTTLVDFETDNVYSITELALGVDWTRQTSRGSEFFARAGYEVQFWDNFTGEPFFDGGESIGFEGFVLGAGIRR
jgi:hypothetical protein